MRDFFLRSLIITGTTALLTTEAFGRFKLLNRPALLSVWLVFSFCLIAHAIRKPIRIIRPRFEPIATPLSVAIAWIVGATGLTAALSPPNTFDALAYHLPRVVYWAQAKSVDFFPTSYLHQISFPPLAEYLILHSYILMAGDGAANLVGWTAFTASIVAVGGIASELGAKVRGQMLAAFFCATLPGGILQASGAKNDCVLALWILSVIYFALRGNSVLTGVSIALAIATKGTAFLFAPPLVAAALLIRMHRQQRPHWIATLTATIAACLLLNGPHFIRNLEFSGSPLGFSSPFANGTFEVANKHPGWKALLSNVARNTSAQLGSRNARWNREVYSAVNAVHGWLGIDPQDPDTTWQWSSYQRPDNTRHEADANNRFHLLIFSVATALALFLALRKRETPPLLYCAALITAFLFFCFYLRWQPYGARLLAPLFIAMSPVVGILLERTKPQLVVIGVCFLLLDQTRLPLLENWTRPLRGPNSLFAKSRESRYFADIQSMNNEQTYRAAANLVVNSRCQNVGIDIGKNQLEYPLLALILKRAPGVHFQHVGVENASLRYLQRDTPQTCAVVCLDCVGDVAKERAYTSTGTAQAVGQFLVFTRPQPGQH